MSNVNTPLLEIRNLHASIEEDGTEILRGIDLTILPGEVHAVMGPNGSGKSTLAHVLSGRPGYKVTQGTVSFLRKDFLGTAVNAVRRHRGQPELDAMDFLELLDAKAKLVEMEEALLNRSVNEGFSGGEKKRNEVLQMALLDPRLAILDETDSGLDIDALRVVAGGVNKLSTPDNAMVLVTHYQRLLNYIVPDYVHVMD